MLDAGRLEIELVPVDHVQVALQPDPEAAAVVQPGGVGGVGGEAANQLRRRPAAALPAPTLRANYLRPALALGLVEMTRPESPTAKNQA